jgi:thiosulfate dehydrogenase [quinone] large subunit
MWTAVLPPENNPFMDDHLVYAMVLVALALVGAGRTVGLGAAWERLSFVQRHGWLK